MSEENLNLPSTADADTATTSADYSAALEGVNLSANANTTLTTAAAEVEVDPVTGRPITYASADNQQLGGGWLEPDSQAAGSKYPYVNVTETESGHSLVFDDTPNNEHIRIQHRNGAYSEWQSDGTKIDKIVGEDYEIVLKDKKLYVQGILNITVVGDCLMHVHGSMKQKIEGDFEQVVTGKYTVVSQDEMKIISRADMDIAIGGDDLSPGTMTLTAGSEVYVNSDLRCGGGISGITVYGETSIGSGDLGGVKAGLLGFVSLNGGLSLGVPVAIPGQIFAVGTITSGVLVTAPLVYGVGAVFDSMGSMQLMRIIYNTHFHPGPKGPTGTAIAKM